MSDFADLLASAAIPVSETCLLRHSDTRYPGHPSPHELWHQDRQRFDAYQSTQSFGNRSRLRAPYWASFVGMPGNVTLFVGLYSAERIGTLPHDRDHPVDGSRMAAGSCDLYALTLLPTLSGEAGRLRIAWGPGYRSWIQRAGNTPKKLLRAHTASHEAQTTRPSA